MSYDPSLYNDYRPNVGVTVAPFIYDDEVLKVLVYKLPRGAEELDGGYTLPNSFFRRDVHDSAEAAAYDALSLKTKASILYLEQLHTFSGLYIDPDRINTVNVCYFALLRSDSVHSLDDSEIKTKWVSVSSALRSHSFAFNHKEVLKMAFERICSKAEYKPVACHLLADKFTIAQFRDLTADLLGVKLDNSIFRDKIKQSNILIECIGEKSSGGSHRPAQLFKFNQKHKGYFYPRSLSKVK